MALKSPKQLQPGEMITAKALADAGYHAQLGNIVKGEPYTIPAGQFPLGLLERPDNVIFPFETAAQNNDSGGVE